MNRRLDTLRAWAAHPLANLVLARLREFLREPEAVFWVYVFPLVMVVALGVAFRHRPVENFRVAIAAGPRAATIVQALQRDARFQAEIGEAEACQGRLRTGRADLVIVGDADAADRFAYHFDPSKTESMLARNAADDVLQRAAGRRDVVAATDHELHEPGGRYIDFLVPGLLGMGLMGGGLWGVGFAIVDMRIRKLLKRYLATPMKRSHFLGAVILSRLLFALPEVVLLLLFARLVFGVTSAGGYVVIAFLILLGALAFSGIGLLLACRAQTIESVSGLMNAVMVPMWIGSGIFFSIERFPSVVQPALWALPLTPLIHALRSVMLEGAGLVAIGGDLGLLVAWGVVSFALALRWFRWT